MENNPGDSSSESDIADPWSIIDRDSCEPEDILVDRVVKDTDSISGEPSDGESLEVIDEEEKHEDEYKDADVETDGISIISESERSNDLEQPLSLAVSKEKKYLHHPNTYLNTRLNVLLALSFAAVTGLGLGHFLGLQEECPFLNESTTNLLTKLQHDNQLLQYKIDRLMSENNAAARLIEQIRNKECRTDTKFRNEGTLHLHPSLQVGIHENPLNLEISGYHATLIESQQHTSDSRNQDDDEVRNIVKQSPVLGVGRALVDENSEYVTLIKYEEETAVKPPTDREKDILTNPKNSLTPANMQHVERNSASDFTDHVDSVAFEQFMAHDSSTKFSDEVNFDKSYNLLNKKKTVAEFPLVMNDDKNAHESSVKNDGVAHSLGQVKEKGFVFPIKDGDVVLEHTLTTDSSGGDTSPEVNRNVDSLQPEVIEETYDWKENNIEVIKSTLILLQAQYDDVASTDTGRLLSSSIALATEIEQSLVHLQDTIAECEVQKTDFCAQFQKRVEVSVSKLKETAEGLVDDIDERLYKLVSTIVRKLKKFKGKLQDKWCHLTDKYDYDSDAIYSWLHSSVLLECKESDKQTRRKFNQFSVKERNKLNDKFVRSTSDEKQEGTYVPDISKSRNAKEENDFKSVDSNMASEVDQKNIPVREFHVNNKEKPKKVSINHDSLSEQHFKIKTPVTVPEESGKSTGQEQYMSKSQKYFKHDNGGTFKRHFNRKQKDKHEDEQRSVPQSKTCWQTHNGKTVCHKCKISQPHLHSEDLKGQGCEDNHWYEKKKQRNQFNDKKTRQYKNHETENNWHNQYKHHKQSVILEQGVSWILDDTNTLKQSNLSGDWILKVANNRAERRKLERRSDWVFDRAAARKLKREEQHLTDNWYFERARGREYCRYHPHSDWCKTGTYSGPNYDWLHQRDY